MGITKEDIDRVNMELEAKRDEMNRLSRSCKGISDELLNLSEEVDALIVRQMRLSAAYKQQKPTA